MKLHSAINKRVTTRVSQRRLKKAIIGTGLSGVLCLSLATAIAGPVDITNDPLFIADAIAPGIFVMMDDSGSMEWEVLTAPFYDYEDYYEDDSSIQTHGRFFGLDPTGDCTGWTNDYSYIFKNPDNLYTTCGTFGVTIENNPGAYARDWRILSADFNVMYYDPAQDYKPWPAKDDDSSNAVAAAYSDADFANARSDPHPDSDGYGDFRDLDGFIWEVADNFSYGFCGTSPDGPEADYDHNRCASDADCGGVPGSCTLPQVDLWDSHTRYKVDGGIIKVDKITYPNFPVAGDCPSDNDPTGNEINNCFGMVPSAQPDITGAAVDNIKQNIANWYQYSRKRSLVAKAAVASVLESTPFYRFGMSTLQNEFFAPLPTTAITDYIPHNQDLFNEFAKWDWQSQSTHLRKGLNQAGKYFKGDLAGPNPIVHQCQQNFTILMTDGFYNGSNQGFGDENGDGVSESLADIAYYYYDTDLDAGFANVVPTTTFDTQDQQHMVTFSVAFGVKGNLVDHDASGWPGPPDHNHTTNKWYTGAVDTNPERIDDMWHAAYDSRGAFISAKNPAELVAGLNDALSAIADKVGAASSAAASTGASVLTETNVFFAFFDSSDWSGDLLAFDIVTDATTGVSTFGNSIRATVNFYGNARTQFYSWDPAANSAIDFDWANLNATQKGYLNDNPDTNVIEDDTFGEKRLDFIKGDKSNDGDDIDPSLDVVEFRDRKGKTFGDILNSAPQFIGGTLDSEGDPLAFINEDFTEGGSYAAFQVSNKDRTHMMYVGTNDGMLHGLIVDSDPATTLVGATAADILTLAYLEDYGQEAFAYTPSAVIKRLNRLTSSDYQTNGIAKHRYLVDGTPTIDDAYIGNNWKTVLVSGLSGGGQGIFALDVTDGATTANNNVVLWEFNDSDDADLGYTYSQPLIARLHDGEWYAIFGNGYNNSEVHNMDAIPDLSISTTGHAVLFLLKLSGPGNDGTWDLGTDYYKLDTKVGSVLTPNALASVSTLDLDRDQVTDAVYAGDLQGNMWRFDLLDVAPGGAGAPLDSNINGGSFPSGVTAGATTPNAYFRVAYGTLAAPAPVFTTTANQPITSAPVVASHPIDGFMVIFGTGQYVATGDNTILGAHTQSFYGIWDSCVENHRVGNDATFGVEYKGASITGSCATVAKAKLLQQSVVKEDLETFTDSEDATNNNDEDIRVTTGYKLLDYDEDTPPTNVQVNTAGVFTYTSETGWLNEAKDDISHQGWYLDMTDHLGDNKAERNINKALLFSGTVFFNTYTPTESAGCGVLGETWIYSLNASDGRQLSQSAFDLNRDNKVDKQDEYGQAEVIGARKMSGYTPGGVAIGADEDGIDSVYSPGKVTEDVDGNIDLGGGTIGMEFNAKEGRQSWRVIK